MIINIRRTGHENKRPYRAFRAKRLEVKTARRKPYVKGKERESVVRHRETDEELAKAIIKRRGLK